MYFGELEPGLRNNNSNTMFWKPYLNVYRYWVFRQEKMVTSYEGRTKKGGIEEELKVTDSG